MVVFLWWCSCGGVQSTTPVLQSTTPYYKVLLCTTKYYSSTTPYYKVLLRTTKYYSSTTKYYSITTKYYSSTTKYYSSTTPYYKVLLQYYPVLQSTILQYYSVLQSTTPTSETTSERRPSSTTPYYASTTKASKTSISCEASATFQGTSLQNEHFVRGFPQISQKKLPKRAFRAMLKASKMIISCEASSKFHRTVLPKRAFRAMLPTIFTKHLRFATVSRDRHTDSCERVHPPKAKCASHYSAVHSQISKLNVRFATAA